MLRNYFKIAFRNIFRNKVFSLINILGLAIGLAVSIIIFVFVKHELSYDKFHSNYKDIYRLSINQIQNDNSKKMALNSPAMGPDLKIACPEIKHFVRITTPQGGNYKRGVENFKAGTIINADSTFFKMFSFKLLQGKPELVLKVANSLVLSESMANKIFRDKNPIGEKLVLNGNQELTVTGIVKDPPKNSHLKFDGLISFNTFSDRENFNNKWDGNFSYYTYLEFHHGTSIDEINLKLTDVFNEKLNKKLEAYGWTVLPILEPLEDIYLKSEVEFNFYETGNINTVYIFIIVAIFILVIACINFMNLSTALSIKRFKEVAIRKVIGASRRKIIAQFLNESILISLLALIASLILIETFIPTFNNLFNKELSLYTESNVLLLLSIPVLVVLIGIFSGSYPAFIMSGLKPVNLMKGLKIKRNRKLNLQNILVVFQFVISVVLIISTTIIYFQMNFIAKKDLGFNNENLLAVSLHTTSGFENKEILRDLFKSNSNIENVTIASNYPASGFTQNGYTPEGMEQVKIFHEVYIDENYISTMGMEIVEGRDFNPEIATDIEKILVNQSLVNELGWENPVGKILNRNGDKEIIGVVKDFHFQTMHKKIGPLVLSMKPRKYMIVSKVKENKMKESILYMEEQWKKITGDNSFTYYLVQDTHKKLYAKDTKFGKIILFFSILAIFIASMGLFGLTAFITTQRTKEIGIRKAIGASSLSINNLIIKQFLSIVLVSLLFAWPLAYYAMNKWLQNYAYKINLHVGYFLLASLLALIIAVFTLSYNSLRASRTNPVNSLKYE